MSDVQLDIREKVFSEDKKRAKEQAEEDYGEEKEDHLVFSNLELVDPEWEKDDDGTIIYYGGLVSNKKDFGWLSVKIKVDMDLAIYIIEGYMKKLGKLKTVLEATK